MQYKLWSNTVNFGTHICCFAIFQGDFLAMIIFQFFYKCFKHNFRLIRWSIKLFNSFPLFTSKFMHSFKCWIFVTYNSERRFFLINTNTSLLNSRWVVGLKQIVNWHYKISIITRNTWLKIRIKHRNYEWKYMHANKIILWNEIMCRNAV